MNATQVLTEFTVFAVWSIVFFFIVKRLNERASRALQREIDELDSRS
jgi:preprotein translocase subunit YajC